MVPVNPLDQETRAMHKHPTPLDQVVSASPRLRLRWLRSAGGRTRDAWDHIRITGQLGGIEDRDRVRRTGVRF